MAVTQSSPEHQTSTKTVSRFEELNEFGSSPEKNILSYINGNTTPYPQIKGGSKRIYFFQSNEISKQIICNHMYLNLT